MTPARWLVGLAGVACLLVGMALAAKGLTLGEAPLPVPVYPTFPPLPTQRPYPAVIDVRVLTAAPTATPTPAPTVPAPTPLPPCDPHTAGVCQWPHVVFVPPTPTLAPCRTPIPDDVCLMPAPAPTGAPLPEVRP